MKGCTLAILLLVMVVYLGIGGVIFHFIESAGEDETRESLGRYREAILANFTCMTEQDLDNLVLAVVTAYDRGVLTTANATSPSNWDIASSIFFSTTVITTIGYGHISPSTPLSKALCVVYGCIGIPFFLVIAADVGNKLKSIFMFLGKCCCRDQQKGNKRVAMRVTVLTMVLGSALFIFVPAIGFSNIESWSYGDAIYYGFVTLSTIGFGDYVAGVSAPLRLHVIYRILTTVWILVGLAWLSSVISGSVDCWNSFVQEKEVKYEVKEENDVNQDNLSFGSNHSAKNNKQNEREGDA